MTPHQLTYASADGIPGRPSSGWGVCHTSGSVDAAVRSRLEAGVTVALPVTMPAFPSADDLARRPIRFRAVPPTRDAPALLWRSVEAGKDHTRRPGNVFTHAVALDLAPGQRVVDFYHSPDWLAPFGADQVRDAVPGEGFAPEQSPVGRLFNWLGGARSRLMPSLPWLVDALLDEVPRGRSIVLVTENAEDAWGWFSLVEYLLPPELAQPMQVSTWEDEQSLPKVLGEGYHLIGVRREPTGPSLDGSRVLDAAWQVTSDGRAWVLPDGDRLERGVWSRWATDLVWLERGVAVEVLRHRDETFAELAAEVSEGQRLDLARWTLRAAMLLVEGAVVVGRADAIRSLFDEPGLPPIALRTPVARSLAEELGSTSRQATRVAVTALRNDGHDPADAIDRSPSMSIDLEKAYSPSGIKAPTATEMTLLLDQPDRRRPDDGDSAGSSRIPDVLDAHAFPTPAAILPAALTVSDTGLAHLLLPPGPWAEKLGAIGAVARLSVVFIVSQDASVAVTSTELDAIHASFAGGASEARATPALLLLAARSELIAGAPLPEASGGAWWRQVSDYVSHLDDEDLEYLALHVDPRTVKLAIDTRTALRWTSFIRAWSKKPVPGSIWGLPNRDGDTVATVVCRHLSLLDQGRG